MPIFVSYSREDAATVKILADGFESVDRTVWYDHNLKGGDIWWSTILRQIRDTDVFLFAKSDHSLKSQACLAELDYAKALRREILPIQVGQVSAERSNLLAHVQHVEFRPDDVISGFIVLNEVDNAARRAGPLPDPLPEEPAIPFAYLGEIRRKIEDGNLSNTAQLEIIEQLRLSLGEENDASARGDIVAMLKTVLESPWRTVAAGKMIGYVLMAHDLFEGRISGGHRPQPDTERKLYETVPGWSEEAARTTFLERINGLVDDLQAGHARQEARNAPPTTAPAGPRVFPGVGRPASEAARARPNAASTATDTAVPAQQANHVAPPKPSSPRAANTARPTAGVSARPPAGRYSPPSSDAGPRPKGSPAPPSRLTTARALAMATLVVSAAFGIVVALLRGGVAAVFLLSAAAGLMALVMSATAAKRIADDHPAEARRPSTLSIVWGVVGIAIATVALIMIFLGPTPPPFPLPR